ncbi:molecular chaperone [Entomohabitans teleogrylli]|uniref:fimbrial biogenesis chaperone n=1 Tax=Entomohabitans teleogrylli TaxID=1384589 RepID=UPI00073D9E23|nr:molecular chaperone [Entomohabitans teleogrylli]
MNALFRFFSVLLLMALLMLNARAGIVIGGTRLIYDGNKTESSLSIRNPDRIVWLIQSWIEPPDHHNRIDTVPFIITPPLFRLAERQQNVMRVVRTGTLPGDRESLYWLNIKSIPSVERRDNTLQFAVKTRIKLIYRPPALAAEMSEEEIYHLVWQLSGTDIEVKNPGPYYINFNDISVSGVPLPDVSWVAPFSTAHFRLPKKGLSGEISFEVINDFGGVSKKYMVKS